MVQHKFRMDPQGLIRDKISKINKLMSDLLNQGKTSFVTICYLQPIPIERSLKHPVCQLEAGNQERSFVMIHILGLINTCLILYELYKT